MHSLLRLVAEPDGSPVMASDMLVERLIHDHLRSEIPAIAFVAACWWFRLALVNEGLKRNTKQVGDNHWT